MSFELRWLRLSADDIHGRPMAIPWGETGLFHVLQMRIRKGPRGEDWWGEWHDVPVVAG